MQRQRVEDSVRHRPSRSSSVGSTGSSAEDSAVSSEVSGFLTKDKHTFYQYFL